MVGKASKQACGKPKAYVLHLFTCWHFYAYLVFIVINHQKRKDCNITLGLTRVLMMYWIDHNRY